jgi:parallel beta-helix repeat protein
VITANTTLTANLGPCAKGGLVIGADNVVLDLAGHTISGRPNRTGDGVGIRVAGRTGVVIRNGTVRDFDAGVAIVNGSSAVTVENVLAKDNRGTTKRGDFGDGIAIVGSSDNTVVGSDVVGNGPFSGISLVGVATGNLIEDNVVGENSMPSTGDDGIRIEGPGATNNILRGNTVGGNTLDGIAVLSDQGTGQPNSANLIEDNLVTANGFGFLEARPGDGIRTDPTATNTTIRANQVHDNAGNGINVTNGSLSNQILGNTATGNGRQAAAAFDLTDGNALCDANVWSGNDFGTANQVCTTSP